SPSFVRSSSRSLAYAFSSSIIATTSPGISRGSVKTMSDAISSDGIATTSRFARYLLSIDSPAPAPAAGRTSRPPGGVGGLGGARSPPCQSSTQPRRHQPAAVVVADVGPIVLQRTVPHADIDARRHGDVVLLLREVPLDL